MLKSLSLEAIKGRKILLDPEDGAETVSASAPGIDGKPAL
jgi:hypothetical protein